jgi:hypothetical protein
MIATSKTAPTTVVGTTASNIENIIIFIGAENERVLKDGWSIVNLEFMPTFPPIGSPVVCFVIS